MKVVVLIITSIISLLQPVAAQDAGLFNLYGTKLVNDSAYYVLTHNFTSFATAKKTTGITALMENKKAAKEVLHTTKKGRKVELYYFPGLSDRKALVIGGMHGSELSSIEVAKTLISKLSTGEKPYYTVIIVPSLFPDNAHQALQDDHERIAKNTGRFTTETTADPNRQMPLPGKPFLAQKPVDAVKREIEEENRVLLQLIQAYMPDRIVSIHAIKNKSKAGVFADPRTDCTGYALGFETDKSLAIMMAQHIQSSGGSCPGNNLQNKPTALYYLDPPVANEGQKQQRNYNGSNIPYKGHGVSLGSWASTAVCSPSGEYNRPAIRTFTMEFPGYFRQDEYTSREEQQQYAKMVQVYAASIQHYFLHSFFVEEYNAEGKRFASN